jgi:hypothetical protein
MACTETYAGFCVYSATLGPAEISNRIGFAPTSSHERDEQSRFKPNREHNFWLWSTKGLVDSTDHMDHLSAIFSKFAGRESALSQLRSDGCTTSISCYWDTDGQGGPYLTADSLKSLVALGVDIWWDIYFDSGESAQ